VLEEHQFIVHEENKEHSCKHYIL